MPDITTTVQQTSSTATAAVGAATDAVKDVAAAAPVPVPVPAPVTAVASAPAPKVAQVAATVDHVVPAASAGTDAVAPVVTAATQPVAPVADGVAQAVAHAPAASAVVDGATQAAAPAAPAASAVVDGATQAAAPAVSGATEGAKAVAPVVSGATDGATQAIAPAAHAPAAVVDGATGVAGPIVVHVTGPDAVALPSSAGGAPAETVHHVLAAPPLPGGGLAAALAPDSMAVAVTQGAAPAPSGAGHAAGVAAVATDPRLIAVAGVSALAGTAYVAVRGVGGAAGGDPSVILNNVRLIPCLVRQSVGVAGTSARAGLDVVDTSMIRVLSAVKHGVAGRVADPLREGFDRVTGLSGRERRGGGGSPGGGDLLLVQIGVAIGLVYAAALSAWLFAGSMRRGGGRTQA